MENHKDIKIMPKSILTRKWWMLDEHGNPLDPETFLPRPKEAIQDEDPCHPWHLQYSHLHGKNEKIVGIHMHGTLIEVHTEFERTKLQQSTLPIIKEKLKE